MAKPTVEEILKQLESEGSNLTAANRKVDSLTIFTNFLLIALIEETQEANKTLKGILRQLRDD